MFKPEDKTKNVIVWIGSFDFFKITRLLEDYEESLSQKIYYHFNPEELLKIRPVSYVRNIGRETFYIDAKESWPVCKNIYRHRQIEDKSEWNYSVSNANKFDVAYRTWSQLNLDSDNSKRIIEENNLVEVVCFETCREYISNTLWVDRVRLEDGASYVVGTAVINQLSFSESASMICRYPPQLSKLSYAMMYKDKGKDTYSLSSEEFNWLEYTLQIDDLLKEIATNSLQQLEIYALSLEAQKHIDEFPPSDILSSVVVCLENFEGLTTCRFYCSGNLTIGQVEELMRKLPQHSYNSFWTARFRDLKLNSLTWMEFNTTLEACNPFHLDILYY